MMTGPIVTSRLLMDLEDVARREDLTPFDPWGSPPLYPDCAHDVVTLGLDGEVRRVPVDMVEWRDVAAYRFQDKFGLTLDDGNLDDWEPY